MQKEKMRILGVDIGISSIGWAIVEMADSGDLELVDCGVRIFQVAEGDKGKSVALDRREARGARVRLKRRKARLNIIKSMVCSEFGLNVSDYLADSGELPKAYETSKDMKNPYELRALALREKLEAKDLARVILHIAKHRGYGNKHAKNMTIDFEKEQNKKGEKSTNTKSDEKDRDDKEVKNGLMRVYKMFKSSECESIGEFLYQQLCKAPQTNVRNKNGAYSNMIYQDWNKGELELIFARQETFGWEFSKDFKNKLMDIIFLQRPLKDFSHLVGECVFCAGEKRAAKATPSAIEFVALARIINTLENLSKRVGEVYSDEVRERILSEFFENGKMSYKRLREILKLPETEYFSDSKLDYTKALKDAEKINFLESKELISLKKALGESFNTLSRQVLDSIATDITLTKDRESLRKKLSKYTILGESEIENLSDLNFKKHIHLSLEALEKILPLMRKGKRYDEACREAGLSERRVQKSDLLPPFSESIFATEMTNPVVVRALSEYRKVVNALIKKYGKFHKINIELTREVGKNHKTRKKHKDEQERNRKARDYAKQDCDKIGLDSANSENIMKLRLWREQGEFCAYSGKKITIEDLRDNKLQRDHIYPYSRSFDDSYMNKVLVFTSENQNKGNKTPYEAWGADSTKWQIIEGLAAKLPKPKQKRVLNRNFKDKESGFIARNLNDTSYIARLVMKYTKEYLEFEKLAESEVTISGEKGSKIHVEAVSGMLSQTLRHYMGFGDKDRSNHLHHAIDAVIVACVNASVIKKFSDFKKLREENKAKKYAKQIKESEYKNNKKFFEIKDEFRTMVLEKVEQIFVSKPPRKRARGALHKETFYKESEFYKEYGGEAGVQKALELGKIRKVDGKIVKNAKDSIVRVDIFRDKNGKFYGVPVYTMDFALGILPNKAVVQSNVKKDGIIKEWLEMDTNYEFIFSLCKGDLINVKRKGMDRAELCYFVSFKSSNAQINVAKPNLKVENLSENEKALYTSYEKGEAVGKSIGIKNLEVFEKWQIDILGKNLRKIEKEVRQPISLKTTKKHDKKQGEK